MTIRIIDGLDKDEWLVEYRGFGTDGDDGRRLRRIKATFSI